MDKKKLILFLTGSGLLLLIPVFIFVSFFFPGKGSQGNPQVTPVPPDFKKDYSRIIYIVPGKSTREDVIKILGGPLSETIDKNRTVFDYPTPNPDFKNSVVLGNGVVSFATEYVYSTYRGLYPDYVAKHGQPELLLYSKENEGFDWFIFLKKGVGIESSNNEITRIVYFAPQDKASFIKTVASFLGLLEAPPEPQGEILVNPGL